MKNADMPANPTYELNAQNVLEDTSYGLTKREMFAMHAMQGLISVNAIYNGRADARDLLAKDAIAHADALLEELEK